MLFIAVDGGGTRTPAIAANEDGEVLGYEESGPTNYHNVGLEQCLDTLNQLLSNLLAKVGYARADGIFLGLAGIDSTRDHDLVERGLKRLGHTGKHVLRNDTELLLYASTMGKPGLAVISGTGSNVLGRNRDGDSWRAVGVGHLLGDQGSAYAIGLEALRSAVKSFDGRGPRSMLEWKVCEIYGVPSIGDLAGEFYSSNPSIAEIASIAKYVTELAELGDQVCLQILRRSAAELSEGAVAVAKKLGMTSEPLIVGVGGGVFNNSPQFLKAFRRKLAEKLPRAKIRGPLPDDAHVLGGIIFFQQENGINVDEHMFARMSEDLRRLRRPGSG